MQIPLIVRAGSGGWHYTIAVGVKFDIKGII